MKCITTAVRLRVMPYLPSADARCRSQQRHICCSTALFASTAFGVNEIEDAGHLAGKAAGRPSLRQARRCAFG